MSRYLWAALMLTPVLELAILLQIGEWMGLWPTIALILGTGFFGVSVARRQGTEVLADVGAAANVGTLPTLQMLNGLLIVIAAVLLLTPGYLTDIAGLVLLIKPLRRRVVEVARRKWLTHLRLIEVHRNDS